MIISTDIVTVVSKVTILARMAGERWLRHGIITVYVIQSGINQGELYKEHAVEVAFGTY